MAISLELTWSGSVGAADQPAAAVAPEPGNPAASGPDRRRVFLALPYAGAESHRGQSGQSFGTGFLVGTLLGARLGRAFSLNGELAVDVANVKSAPAGTQASRLEFDVAVSPLCHLHPRGIDLVFGPKLGVWYGRYQLTSAGRTVDSESARGLVGALNLGMFVPVAHQVSLGGMLSAAVKTISRTCATPVGQEQTCNPAPNLDAEKVIGITGGALF